MVRRRRRFRWSHSRSWWPKTLRPAARDRSRRDSTRERPFTSATPLTPGSDSGVAFATSLPNRRRAAPSRGSIPAIGLDHSGCHSVPGVRHPRDRRRSVHGLERRVRNADAAGRYGIVAVAPLDREADASTRAAASQERRPVDDASEELPRARNVRPAAAAGEMGRAARRRSARDRAGAAGIAAAAAAKYLPDWARSPVPDRDRRTVRDRAPDHGFERSIDRIQPAPGTGRSYRRNGRAG